MALNFMNLNITFSVFMWHYLHSPSTPSWRGAQLKHKNNFTFTFTFTFTYVAFLIFITPSAVFCFHCAASFTPQSVPG
jgi:hypothetical protein